MNKIIVVILMLLSGVTSSANDSAKFQILPKPQKMEMGDRGVLALGELKYIISQEGEMPVLGAILDGLPRSTRKGKGVVLSLTTIDVPKSEEGYTLSITKSGVTINARTEAGLFYGCVTLEQMLEDCRDFGLQLPKTEIVDYPKIAFRAVYFDTKHHLSRAEYYYDIIDRLASYKINAVIWEIEDKLRFERRAEIGAPNALSKQEMQAISRYAKERNVELSPLIQGLGHAGFILKHHWELREKLHSDWEFCPSDPKTYEVQFDLYRDAIEAMPDGKYLHIGGDEISGIGIDERCKATGKSPFELQMEWLHKVCDFAIANGRTPIFWDDMPLKYAGLWRLLHGGMSDAEVEAGWSTAKLDEAVELFPKNCIYMRWHYTDPTILANIKVLEWYKSVGLEVMAATAASPGEAPYIPRDDSRAQYIKDFCELVEENNLIGIVSTSWDDGSSHWETVMRGYIAQGEFGWNPTGRSVEEFKSVHAQREYGFIDNEESYLDKLEDLATIFDNILVVKGRRNPAYQVREFKLLGLPNRDSVGVWSKKYDKQLADAHRAVAMHESIVSGLRVAQDNALRNRYTIDVYEQLAELFVYSSKVIVALHRYDVATDEQEVKDAKRQLYALVKGFQVMRTNLESVFSSTRFMEAPAGYIADHNHHMHLAALTMNSDWIFLYELAMIEEINRHILRMGRGASADFEMY